MAIWEIQTEFEWENQLSNYHKHVMESIDIVKFILITF